MDYNKLKTLTIIGECGSISETARRLRRSQSAISQQIMALEDELELKLLERKNSKVYLSKDAESLVNAAKYNFDSIDETYASLKSTMESLSGHIKIGALQDSGTDISIGEIVGSFSRQNKNVTFEIIGGTSLSLEKDLIENRLDFLFSVVFEQKEFIRRYPIKTSYHSLYASKQYLEKSEKIQKYKDIFTHQLIDLSHNFLGLERFLQKNAPHLAATLKHRKPDIISPNLLTTKDLVLSHSGIAMLPDFLIQNELQKKKVVPVFPKAKKLFGTMDFAVKKYRNLRHYEQLFLDHCASSFTDKADERVKNHG